MYKAVLFDLDGTLLPISTDDFISEYFNLLTSKVKEYINPKIFINRILEATEKTIKNNNSGKTNEDIFLENFLPFENLNSETVMMHLDDFYKKEYCTICHKITPNFIVKDIMELLEQKSIIKVVATNAVFPEIAILERLRWVGLSSKEFKFISTYEKMHACKPSLEYYLEICDNIQVAPEHCLMVGNDLEEDMIVEKLGMDTFLINPHTINRNNVNLSGYKQGTLDDLYSFLQAL
jgi:FMN phosphatase YigB (HAD superfamily)